MRTKLVSIAAAFATIALITTSTVFASATFPSRVRVDVHVDSKGGGVEFENHRDVDIITTFSSQPSTWAGSGWHYHQGPVFVSVTQGTLTFYRKNCKTFTITAGHGYIETRHQVLNAKNLDPNVVAEWFTTRIIPYQRNGQPGIDPVPVVHAACP
jgi:hypothetical protein